MPHQPSSPDYDTPRHALPGSTTRPLRQPLADVAGDDETQPAVPAVPAAAPSRRLFLAMEAGFMLVAIGLLTLGAVGVASHGTRGQMAMAALARPTAGTTHRAATPSATTAADADVRDLASDYPRPHVIRQPVPTATPEAHVATQPVRPVAPTPPPVAPTRPPAPAPTQPPPPPVSPPSSGNHYGNPWCNDAGQFPGAISQWTVPPSCYAGIYTMPQDNLPSWGWCNWVPEFLHMAQFGVSTAALTMPGHGGFAPVPGATVFFYGGEQGASSAGHYATVIAVGPNGWNLIAESNFSWRGGGWGKIDFRYIHNSSGLEYRY